MARRCHLHRTAKLAAASAGGLSARSRLTGCRRGLPRSIIRENLAESQAGRIIALLSVRALNTEYKSATGPAVRAAQDVSFEVPRGKFLHAARAVRMRQDDDVALHRRARASHDRRHRSECARRLFFERWNFHSAEPPQLRNGLPVLCDLAAYECLRQCGVPARSRPHQLQSHADSRSCDARARRRGPRSSRRT